MSADEDDEVRAVALFVRSIWVSLFERNQRRPTPAETVVASYAAASSLIDAEVGNVFRYLGCPSPNVRGALRDISSGAVRYSRQLTDSAGLVLAYFDQAGDSQKARTEESIRVDRQVLACAARDFRITDAVSDSAIGREIGLSQVQVRDRRLCRSARIMNRLHVDAPMIWGEKGLPVASASTEMPALAA